MHEATSVDTVNVYSKTVRAGARAYVAEPIDGALAMRLLQETRIAMWATSERCRAYRYCMGEGPE